MPGGLRWAGYSGPLPEAEKIEIMITIMKRDVDQNQNDRKDVIGHLELLLQLVSQPQVVSPIRIHHILKQLFILSFTSHMCVCD